MQLHAPLHTTPYHNFVLLSLQCGKKQRPCKHTYENFARCAQHPDGGKW